jgi:hypothetical protein
MSALSFVYLNPVPTKAEALWDAESAASQLAQKALYKASIGNKGGAYDLTQQASTNGTSTLQAACLSSLTDQLLNKTGAVNPFKPDTLISDDILFQTNDNSIQILLTSANIDIGLENTIVKTPLTGKRGTVKEFIQARDYTIDISGSLFSDSQNAYPIDLFIQFVELFNTEANLKVANVRLNKLGINYVVMENYFFPKSKFLSVCEFKLKLLSDNPFSLTVT